MPLLMIHPETGTAICLLPGEGELARALVLDGFNPIGPRGKAEAEEYRATFARAKEILIQEGVARGAIEGEAREVRDGEW